MPDDTTATLPDELIAVPFIPGRRSYGNFNKSLDEINASVLGQTINLSVSESLASVAKGNESDGEEEEYRGLRGRGAERRHDM